MSTTWNTASTGAVFGDPVNSELYFAEQRRNRWTAEGQIERGPRISQYRFQPPRVGIKQDWSGEERRGAAMGKEGGLFNMFSGLVKTGIEAREARKEQQKAQAQQAQVQAQQYQQGVANWQGAYQQASQRSQSNQMANQMASLMMGTHPSQQTYKPFSIPPGPSTPLNSPTAIINRNARQWSLAAQQQKNEAIANWQGTYQQASQASQTQQMRNQMMAVYTAEPFTPAQPTPPSSDPNAPRRSGQRTPGWK